jgi:hypothetical protein
MPSSRHSIKEMPFCLSKTGSYLTLSPAAIDGFGKPIKL